MAEGAQVTAAEIARLAGVGRAAVSNWRRRHGDFPRPVGGTDTSPTFNLSHVETWLNGQGKLRDVPVEQQIWQLLDAARRDRTVEDLLVLVGSYLRARSTGDRPERLSKRDARLLASLDDLVASGAEEATFEALVERYTQARSRQLAATPQPLAEVMVSLAGAPAGTVLDPACGTGSVLRAAVRAGDGVRAVGQELDAGLARLAAVRLSFIAAEPDIRTGDSLRADAFAGVVADAVVSNPPFTQRDWGAEDLAYDARWEYGLPARGESELAWIQHGLAHVGPGGRVVMLMPPAVAYRRSGRRIRAELLRRGALRAVIALPAGLAAPFGLSLSLWVLVRPSSESSAGDGLLLVDAASGGTEEAGPAGWAARSEQILDTWRAFGSGDLASTHQPGHSRVMPIIELLDDDVDLTPARYLRAVPANVTGGELTESRDSLAGALSELVGLLPAVDQAVADGARQATISVGDLAKSGALTIRQQVGPSDVHHGGDGVPVLTARDVTTGAAPSGRVADVSPQTQELLPGDVVTAVIGGKVAVHVVESGGAVLGSNLYLLRVDPAVLDPWFLSGCLRSSANLRFATGSLASRIDVRRLEVPRVPLTEQARYGKVFQRLFRFESGIAQAASTGRDLVQAITDGLAGGGLRPPADDDS